MCICNSSEELRARAFSLPLLPSVHVALSVSQLLSKAHLRHLFALDLYSVDILPFQGVFT